MLQTRHKEDLKNQKTRSAVVHFFSLWSRRFANFVRLNMLNVFNGDTLHTLTNILKHFDNNISSSCIGLFNVHFFLLRLKLNGAFYW